MKRHTYINTAHTTASKWKFVKEGGLNMLYGDWKREKKKDEIDKFADSIKKRYGNADNPFIRYSVTVLTKDETVKFHQYGTLLYTLLSVISDVTPNGDIKVSTRKDGIFVENIKRYEGGEITLRAHIEILDDEARKVWEDGGDEALDEFLMKYPKEHIINDRYDTLCDRVLV